MASSASSTVRSFRTALQKLPKEVQLLAAFLAVAVWLLALAMLVAKLEFARIHRFDHRVLIWFRHADDLAVPIGPEWLLAAAREITALGSATVLVFVTLSVAGYLLLERRYGLLALVLVATSGGTLLCVLLKDFFARTRPNVVPHLVAVESASFPSGHSLLSAVVYLTLGALLSRVSTDRVTKIYLVTLSAVLTVLIGVSRVYLGVHYPTDVLGGWVLGGFWSLGCVMVARELQRRRLITPEKELRPQRVTRSSSAA
jgi:undecaprenyl-diphosphatase